MVAPEETVLDAEAIARTIRRLALEVVERTRGTESLCLVGIHRGGVPIANRMAEEIRRVEGREIPVGTLDITLYRDDASTALPDPKIGPSEIDFDVKGKEVVLVDDVLHTGRTIRAAIDCLLDYGRPRRVWLAVLCDRGHRELPISADFVGRSLDVGYNRVVDVVLDGSPSERVIIRHWFSQFPPPMSEP